MPDCILNKWLKNKRRDKRFFRINRKYFVSVESIQDMISYTNSRLKLVLKTSDDHDIIVARERVQEFKEWLDH